MGGKTVTTESYIKDVKKIHEGKNYEYKPDWEYTHSKCIIEVKCPEHGWWTTKAYSHRGMKSGCPACAEISRDIRCNESKRGRLAREYLKVVKSQQERDDHYAERIANLHGDSVEVLSECLPEGCYILLKCRKHNHTYYRGLKNLRSKGCKFCAEEAIESNIETLRKSNDQVVSDFIQVHGDKYDYSKTKYLNSQTKVEIICREHGPFWITPNNHLAMKSGCASCAKTGFDKNKSAILYYIKISTNVGDYYKIGITNLAVSKRFSRDKGKYLLLDQWYYENGQDAYDEEQRILKNYSEYKGCPEDFEWFSSGTTEMFVKDILGLDNTM